MRIPTYIGPERQLTGHPAPCTEVLISQLIDQVHHDSEEFIRTKGRGPLVRVIQAIVSLNRLGYDFIWDRRRHIVGAHRKETADVNQQRIADTTAVH